MRDFSQIEVYARLNLTLKHYCANTIIKPKVGAWEIKLRNDIKETRVPILDGFTSNDPRNINECWRFSLPKVYYAVEIDDKV